MAVYFSHYLLFQHFVQKYAAFSLT